jgi:CheY-like chemotaxis protein
MDRLKTVLVVEDNADDAELLRLAAEKVRSGLSFHFVTDGEQAIAYLKGEGQFEDRRAHPFPDLVLLDLWLTGMNGFEVLAWVRQQPELKRLKVFVWTDAGQPAILDRATRAGADRFVPKSVVFVRGGLVGLVGGISQALMGPAEGDRAGLSLLP